MIPKFTFTANGSEKVGNVNAKILDVNADGTAMRWYVDPAERSHAARVLHRHRSLRPLSRRNRPF